MKSLLVFCSAFIVLLVTAGCNKEVSSSTSYAFTGKLSTGSSFNLTNSNAYFFSDSLNGQKFIEILGVISVQSKDTTQAVIGISGLSKTGTYPLTTLTSTSPTSCIIGYAIGKHGWVSIATTDATGPGTFTVTAISKSSITGTYAARLTDSLNNTITMTGTFNGNF